MDCWQLLLLVRLGGLGQRWTYKPYDKHKQQCQVWVKSSLYCAIQKKHFHVTLVSCDLLTNIECIKRDYSCIRGLEVF